MKIDNIALLRVFMFACLVLLLQACTTVNSFPTVSRPGDTVSIMVGGTEKARKDTISVTLTDAGGTSWNLQTLGLVRSVFNLRPDGRANGLHYGSYLDSVISWSKNHEPVQTVLVMDIPTGVAVGNATIQISNNVDDNSSLINDPFTIGLEIISGSGSPDNFDRRNPFFGTSPVNFVDLEPAPHAKIDFCDTSVEIGALSVIVDFDENVLSPDDINVYSPEAVVRGSAITTGAFGKTQRMLYWRQDGDRIFIDTITPQGIDCNYIQLFLVHPNGLPTSPNFILDSVVAYDINGQVFSLPEPTTLDYFP